MTYQEAIEVSAQNQGLIGKTLLVDGTEFNVSSVVPHDEGGGNWFCHVFYEEISSIVFHERLEEAKQHKEV